MNAKQDRQGVRRAADLEQKYSFGSVFKNQDTKNKEQSERLNAQNMSMEQFRQYAISYFGKMEEAMAKLTEENQTLSENLGKYWETVYPVGSVYVSLNENDPATLFGGSWERIKDMFLLSAGDSYQAGDMGGEAEHKLTTEEMPEHTHERGTMDITGYLKCYSQYNKGNDDYWATGSGGAFYKDPDNYMEEGSTLNQSDSASYDSARTVSFKASRAWTGETSAVGGSTAHNNMPPYLAVYMWKRTA